MTYRWTTLDDPKSLKEAACRLAFDVEPQAAFVFCSVADYVDAGMKGERAKIANAWDPGVFYLMPDANIPRGEIHAMTPGADFASPDHEYEQSRIRYNGSQ